MRHRGCRDVPAYSDVLHCLPLVAPQERSEVGTTTRLGRQLSRRSLLGVVSREARTEPGTKPERSYKLHHVVSSDVDTVFQKKFLAMNETQCVLSSPLGLRSGHDPRWVRLVPNVENSSVLILANHSGKFTVYLSAEARMVHGVFDHPTRNFATLGPL